MAVFPKVDAASPRGLMAPPGLRPWAPRVLSGIGSAFRTGSPGSALGSYVISLCAYPAWDTQVSRSWSLACPIRGLPFSRLTDWGGMAPCGANINAALRRRPPLVAGATTLPGGKHVTGFSVAYGSLRIQFFCHPRSSVGRQKESALMGRLGALLCPTWRSYAGPPQGTIKLRYAVSCL